MSESVFRCPVCGSRFEREAHVYRCSQGHCFDISSAGHVNLLPANKKHSKAPGDDPEMVRARELFLSAGYYAPFAEEIVRIVKEFSGGAPLILGDIGCGEGYYTQKLAALPDIRIGAFDISKTAAEKTAKKIGGKNGTQEAAVASAFDIPMADGSADVLTNVFSPLCLPEITRVLRPGGLFLYAVPSATHLWEMKKAVYDTPYENEETEPAYEGFTYTGKHSVRGRITVSPADRIKALFRMTPYFWHTPKEAAAKLDGIEELETQIGFDILTYTKD